jgi:hypothetical protein
MPGILDADRPNASYISPWALYRSSISASDDLSVPTDVPYTIDLSSAFKGVDSEIWICPVRTSGSGLVTISLVLAVVGSLSGVEPFQVVASAAGADTLIYQRFPNLVAGVYRALLTISGSNTWDLHFAYISRARPAISGFGGVLQVGSNGWSGPPALPPDPTVAWMSYPAGGGGASEWDIPSQTWV